MTRLQKSKLNGQHKLTRVERRAYNKALWHCAAIKGDLEYHIVEIASCDIKVPFLQDVLKRSQALCELCALCVKESKAKGK